jgi:K+-sensing histidine kinase KdpD
VLPPDSASQVTVADAPGLPAIWADHDRLEQVFVNLLGNALGHNPPGTAVTVTAAQAGPGAVSVRVADNGEGLPAELARAVTEAAGQRDPRWHDVLAAGTIRPRRRGSGAGLGLSIASGIVAAHGGRLELEPTEQGTCFLVTLPVERPAAAPADEGGHAVTPGQGSTPGPASTPGPGSAPGLGSTPGPGGDPGQAANRGPATTETTTPRGVTVRD